ncbi:MAG: hypothetical protein IZT57_00725 [Chloroflexi bacterium]|nr:hypothetical protein [Chloroflexota bacterium]
MANDENGLQKKVEVDLIADSVMVGGSFVFKKETPTLTVTKWLADSMVTQGVAKLKGVK